ncbi:hypothetical protein, partial [Pontimicrobium sp. MEBiC01747]
MKNNNKLLFLFIVFITSVLNAQVKCKSFKPNKTTIKCTEASHFDAFGTHKKNILAIDRLGNYYCDAIKTGKQAKQKPSFNKITSQGHFKTAYFGEVPLEFKIIIDQVFEDLEQFLVFQSSCDGTIPLIEIKIMLDDLSEGGTTPLNEQPIATGTSFYSTDTKKGKILRGDLWHRINTGKKTTNQPSDAQITINQNYMNQLFVDGFVADVNNDGIMDYNGINITDDVYDLYGIILHEAIHAMGFISFLDQNGNGIDHFISVFDTLLEHNNTPFVDTSVPYEWSITSGINTNTDFLSPCPANTITTLTDSFSLHSADSDGNFIMPSHINDIGNCFNGTNYIMSPTYNFREYKRLRHDEASILYQLGYNSTGIYGTENLVETPTIINPNRDINYPVSTLNVAYTNDDPCETYETFNICEAPFSINSIANDINFNTHSIVNVEVINLINSSDYINDDLQITTQLVNNTINITPTNELIVGREYKIRYQLQENTTGAISNTSIVSLKILPCDDYLTNFNCNESNNSCNLICNSEFIASNHNMINDFPLMGYGIGYNDVPGWYPLTDRLRYFFNVYQPETLPFMTNPTSTIITNNPIIYLERRRAAMTKLKTPLEANKRYLVSHYSKGNAQNTSLPETHYQYRIGFIESIENGTNYPDTSPYYNAESVTNLIANRFNVSQQVYSFVSDKNYEALFVSGRHSNTRVYFDNVEVIEDRIEEIPTQVEVVCETETTIGENLCTLRGMEFSWWSAGADSTFGTSDDIQLTQNTTDLITTDNTTPTGNGSELNITNVSDTNIYQLRRKMKATEGLHYTETNGLIASVTIPEAETLDFIDNIEITVSCITECNVDVYNDFDTADVTFGDNNQCTAFPFTHFYGPGNGPFPWKATIYYAAYHVLLTEDFYNDYNCDVLLNQGTGTNIWMRPHRIKTPPSGHESVMA